MFGVDNLSTGMLANLKNALYFSERFTFVQNDIQAPELAGLIEGHQSPPAEGSWTSRGSAGSATNFCSRCSTTTWVLYRRACDHGSVRGTIANDRPESLKE